MEKQNRIIGVAGRKGSGKSTKAREILERCPRGFMFDTMGEHAWIPDRHSELNESLIYLIEARERTEFWGSIVPESDDFESEFSAICEEVYDASAQIDGGMMFAVEEVPMLSSANYIPPKFAKIARLGRHNNVSLLYTAQRLGECPRLLTGATDIFVLFCHTEPRDLDHIAERTNGEIARKVSGLGMHGFLVWDVIEQKELTLDAECYSYLVQNPRNGTVTNGR